MPSEEDQLYVRVDGYKVLLQDQEAVRQIISNINEAAEVLSQVREVKEKTIDTVYENLDRMNDKLEDIEMEVPEVEEVPSHVNVSREQQLDDEIDDSVQQLHSELENLQDELSDLGMEGQQE